MQLGFEVAGGYSAPGRRRADSDQLRRIAARDPAALDLRCRLARGLRCAYRPPTPRYDDDSREFSVGGCLVHRFGSQAHNEIRILAALEDEGWPESIDDPLGSLDDPGFKKRLEDAVSALNGLKKRPLVRFSSSGRKIHWAFTGCALKPGARADASPR
jgi:hypothetical protein